MKNIVVAGDYVLDHTVYRFANSETQEFFTHGAAGNVATHLMGFLDFPSQVHYYGFESESCEESINSGLLYSYEALERKIRIYTNYVCENFISVNGHGEKYTWGLTKFNFISNMEEFEQPISAIVFSNYGKHQLSKLWMNDFNQFIRDNPSIPVIVDSRSGDFSNISRIDICIFNDIFDSWQSGIKLCGERGFFHYHEDPSYCTHYPALNRFAFNTIGAGDAFTACLAALVAYYPKCLKDKVVFDAVLKVCQVYCANFVRLQFPNKPKKIINHPYDYKYVSSPSMLSEVLGFRGRTVFTNGCFNGFHAGHKHLLKEIKKQFPLHKLIVSINDDSYLTGFKNTPAEKVIPWEERARTIALQPEVDFVIKQDDETPAGIICDVMPDVLVKGKESENWTPIGADYVLGCGGVVLLIDKLEGISNSLDSPEWEAPMHMLAYNGEEYNYYINTHTYDESDINIFFPYPISLSPYLASLSRVDLEELSMFPPLQWEQLQGQTDSLAEQEAHLRESQEKSAVEPSHLD
jgi:cytidyltransferase-like protein